MSDYSKVPNYIPTPADKLVVKDLREIAELLQPGTMVGFVDCDDILGGIGRDRLEEICEQRQLVVKNRVTKGGIDALVTGDVSARYGKVSEAVKHKIPLITQRDFEIWFRHRSMTTGASSPEPSTTIKPQFNDVLGYNAIITVVGTITVGDKQFSSEEDLRFLGDALDVVFREELIPGKTKAIIAAEDTFDEVDQDAAKALNIPVYTDADFTYWVNEQLTHTTPLGSRSRASLKPEIPQPKHEPQQESDSENTLSKVESPYKKSPDSVLPYPVQALMYDQQQVVPYHPKVNRKLFAATVSGLATVVTYGIYSMGFFSGSMAMALIFGGANMLLNIVTFGLCLTALLDLWKARPPKLSKDYKVE